MIKVYLQVTEHFENINIAPVVILFDVDDIFTLKITWYKTPMFRDRLKPRLLCVGYVNILLNSHVSRFLHSLKLGWNDGGF